MHGTSIGWDLDGEPVDLDHQLARARPGTPLRESAAPTPLAGCGRTIEVSSAGELRVYRAPFVSAALGWVGCGIFFVVGLSMVTVGPSQHDAVGSLVVGTSVLLLSAWLGAVLATNRLTVTRAGLVYRYNLRRRLIGWPEIRSFDVGPSRSRTRWPCLAIQLDNGSVTINGLSSFTATYPARIASELSAMQREIVPGLAPSGDLPEGESP
jgi:hypothetical protein